MNRHSTALAFAGHGCAIEVSGAGTTEERPTIEDLFDLINKYESARHVLAAANYMFVERFGFTFQHVLRDVPMRADTRYYQPLKVGIDLTYLAALCEELDNDVEHIASMALGLSLGEITGAAATHMWTRTETAIHLACERGRVVHEHQPGDGRAWDTRAHIRCVRGIIADAIARIRTARANGAETLAITNVNGDEIVLVAGSEEGLVTLAEELERSGVKRVIVRKNMGLGAIFHHPCLADAAPVFERLVYESGPVAPCIPLLSNVTGEAHDIRTFARTLGEHLRSPVEFSQCLRRLAEHGVERVIVPGAPGALRTLLEQRSAKKQMQLHVFDSLAAVKNARQTLAMG